LEASNRAVFKPMPEEVPIMKAMGKLMENKNVGKYDFYDQK
jgi:hypothetical protein